MDMDLRKLLRDLGNGNVTLEAVLAQIASEGSATADMLREAASADAVELNQFIKKSGLYTNQAAANFFGVAPRTISRWRNLSTQASSPEGIPVDVSRQILAITEDDWRAILRLCIGEPALAPSGKEASAPSLSSSRTPRVLPANNTRLGKVRHMSKQEQLEESHEALRKRREEIWDAPNGIQFIMHAIHNKRWEAPQRTDFKVIDSEKHKRIIADDEGEAIRNYLIQFGSKIFEEARMSKEAKEEAGYSICDEAPARYGRMIYWRWRIEPREFFVFLAGGVGPEKKQIDWADHSQMQLRDDAPNGLMEAVTAYAEAYRACYG